MFEMQEVQKEADYKPLSIRKDIPFTQGWLFGEWQGAAGRKVRRFEIKNGAETAGFLQAIVYPLVFSKKFIYIPHGPVLLAACDMRQVKKNLSQIAKEENAVFVRFDLWPNLDLNLRKYFQQTPVSQYHSSYFQPKFEWTLDMRKSEEELQKEMHPKTRYNINLAQRKGIGIEIVNSDFTRYFDDFYKLLKETAKRDKFSLHPKVYYQNILKTLSAENAFLAMAKYNGKTLAINLILFFGETAHFVYGGSSDEYKSLRAPHLAHWKGILEAKRQNYKFYNFGAVDGNFSAQGGPASGWEGISRFKKGFGGQLLKYSDSYDIVVKPFWYFLYNLRKRFQFR